MTLTIVSGVMIVIGFILNAQNFDLAVPIFITAFIIGGYYSFLNAYRDLVNEKKLNVDVLMIAAAIGDSIFGYWEDGVLLIIIFFITDSYDSMCMALNSVDIYVIMYVLL